MRRGGVRRRLRLPPPSPSPSRLLPSVVILLIPAVFVVYGGGGFVVSDVANDANASLGEGGVNAQTDGREEEEEAASGRRRFVGGVDPSSHNRPPGEIVDDGEGRMRDGGWSESDGTGGGSEVDASSATAPPPPPPDDDEASSTGRGDDDDAETFSSSLPSRTTAEQEEDEGGRAVDDAGGKRWCVDGRGVCPEPAFAAAATGEGGDGGGGDHGGRNAPSVPPPEWSVGLRDAKDGGVAAPHRNARVPGVGEDGGTPARSEIKGDGDEEDELDERTYLDVFGEAAKEFLTQRIIPDTDVECRWDWRYARCEPYCDCTLRPRWGDYHLGRSCRDRPDRDRGWDGGDDEACRPGPPDTRYAKSVESIRAKARDVASMARRFVDRFDMRDRLGSARETACDSMLEQRLEEDDDGRGRVLGPIARRVGSVLCRKKEAGSEDEEGRETTTVEDLLQE